MIRTTPSVSPRSSACGGSEPYTTVRYPGPPCRPSRRRRRALPIRFGGGGHLSPATYIGLAEPEDRGAETARAGLVPRPGRCGA